MKRQRLWGMTAAVLSGLAMPLTYGQAASPYLATEYSYYNGKPFAEIKFMAQNYGIGLDGIWLINPPAYDLPPTLINATMSSTAYWTNILGGGVKNPAPWQIFVTTENVQNAFAYTGTIKSDGVNGSYDNAAFLLGEHLQDGKPVNKLTYEAVAGDVLPSGQYVFSNITIGNYMGAERNGAINGWWVDPDTVLPTNEQAADFVGTFRHELGHALGIGLAKTSSNDDKFYINSDVDNKNSWTLHLVDQNGNAAAPGKQIVTSADVPNNTDVANYFVVDKQITADGKGYAYFVGEHVTEALGGATFFGRSALPVNGWEGDKFEGSHLQTTGMMSHRSYSNYTSFMEVELAVMQDLGYKFDRKAYFGRSIYGNGGNIVNNQGFFQRNAAGTAYLDNTYSTVPLGIGLHIYGSDNTVTQNANIMTTGTGATGIRIDGTGNTVIVPQNTEIHADGLHGNGILVAYGRNQTVEQAGTVTASGEGGTGVRFDFGSSSNGAADEYRGSYIRYERKVNTNGTISEAKNLKLTDMDANTYNANKDELNGPLVENYNLSGTLKGGENAIYISKNAFVKNININKGASISGNITSNWGQFGAAECEGAYSAGQNRSQLLIQYKSGYAYDEYIPDLVTNLNFNADIAYNGNITGKDNMKMNVNAGTLTYEGQADVVNVQVAKGAALLGGTYTVNDMTPDINSSYTDTTTGQLINKGTIGAAAADKNMTINGKLVSSGNLQAYGGGDGGQIVVNGAAEVDGSTVTATQMLPGETKTVLKAQTINGTIANADTATPVSAMLNAQGKLTSSNTLSVETMAANNLGTSEAVVNDTYNAIMTMYDGMGNEKFQQGELRKLFSMNQEKAASALKDISSPDAVQGMTMAQTSTVTSHIISSRLTEAFAMQNVDISVPVASLADDKTETVNEGLKLQAQIDQPVENGIWFKTAKNWGELKGGANYHGTTFALGYDKTAGKNWRVGGFVSYGSSSFAAGSTSSKLTDTRLGVYGGYKRGAHEGFVYLNHGWLKNDLSRGITGIGMAEADYNSHLLELGGEYKYDLQAGKVKTWHVSPYANMQLSRLWQDGYQEKGVGVLGKKANSAANTYFAMGLGLEFKRYLNKGSYAMRIGARHAFSGAKPRVTFGYLGGGPATYEMVGQQDETHIVLSLTGEAEFSPGWTLSGDAVLTRGSHDKDIMCALTLRRMW